MPAKSLLARKPQTRLLRRSASVLIGTSSRPSSRTPRISRRPRRRLASPASEGEVAARPASAASGAADRRAVVADRRRDADGRRAPEHVAPQSHPRDRGPTLVRVERRRHARSISTPRSRTRRQATIRRRRHSPARSSAASSPPTPRARRRSSTARRATGCAALTVVLPSGDVLDIERGATAARIADGYFEIVLADRTVRVPSAALPHAARAEGVGRAISPRQGWT